MYTELGNYKLGSEIASYIFSIGPSAQLQTEPDCEESEGEEVVDNSSKYALWGLIGGAVAFVSILALKR